MLTSINILRSQLPPNYKLYVKEHPATLKPNLFNHFWRSKRFYIHIKNLPNTFLLSSNVKNRDLLAHCKAVSSVSGSICAEALSMGIKVIGFSHLNLIPECKSPAFFQISPSLGSESLTKFLLKSLSPSSIVDDFKLYLKQLPLKHLSLTCSTEELQNPTILRTGQIKRILFKELLLLLQTS